MIKHASIIAVFAAVALTASACGVHQTSAPSLTGPSGFALSVGVTASPDAISQDGHSQSVVVVSARDENGNAKSGQTFRLDMFIRTSDDPTSGLSATDYGTLSEHTVTTGSDGRASVIYTAPPAPPSGAIIPNCNGLPGQCVAVAATPMGTDFTASQTQTVEIRLTPIAIIIPPGSVPVASFIITPTPLTANQAAVFDASGSCAEPLTGGACNPTGLFSPSIVQYFWAYGDGTTDTGQVRTHAFPVAGTYTVTLTVTNSDGLQASSSQTVTVAAGTPTPLLVVTKTGGNSVLADGSGSTAVTGATITNYAFSYVDNGNTFGQNSSSPTFPITFSLNGTYTVHLTVTDSAGRTGSTSSTVQVP